jgi:hypothetical protein
VTPRAMWSMLDEVVLGAAIAEADGSTCSTML